jgi:hypothetical protein
MPGNAASKVRRLVVIVEYAPARRSVTNASSAERIGSMMLWRVASCSRAHASAPSAIPCVTAVRQKPNVVPNGYW